MDNVRIWQDFVQQVVKNKGESCDAYIVLFGDDNHSSLWLFGKAYGRHQAGKYVGVDVWSGAEIAIESVIDKDTTANGMALCETLLVCKRRDDRLDILYRLLVLVFRTRKESSPRGVLASWVVVLVFLAARWFCCLCQVTRGRCSCWWLTGIKE